MSIDEAHQDLARSLGEMVASGEAMLSLHGVFGEYLAVSASVEPLFGRSPDALVGRSAYEFFHPEDLRDLEARHRDMTTCDGTTTVIDYRVRHADGHHVSVRAYGWALPEESDDVRIVAVLVPRDLVESAGADRFGGLAAHVVQRVAADRLATV